MLFKSLGWFLIIFVCNKIIQNMTRQLLSILLVFTIASTAYSQKKEKVKGSRIVSTETTNVNPFQRLVLKENLKVNLVKADSTSVKINTDDNLHEYIKIVSQDSTLNIKTTRKFASEKAFEITVFYNKSLNTIELDENAELSASNSLKFEDLTLTVSESAEAYLTLECNLFKLINNDKAKAELNVTAKAVTLELNNSSKVEALLNASKIEVDMLESADATIEGDTEYLVINADNSSDFRGENLTAKEVKVTTDNRAKVKTEASKKLIIEADGSSIIEIYGSPKITIEKFNGNAILRKK